MHTCTQPLTTMHAPPLLYPCVCRIMQRHVCGPTVHPSHHPLPRVLPSHRCTPHAHIHIRRNESRNRSCCDPCSGCRWRQQRDGGQCYGGTPWAPVVVGRSVLVLDGVHVDRTADVWIWTVVQRQSAGRRWLEPCRADIHDIVGAIVSNRPCMHRATDLESCMSCIFALDFQGLHAADVPMCDVADHDLLHCTPCCVLLKRLDNLAI